MQDGDDRAQSPSPSDLAADVGTDLLASSPFRPPDWRWRRAILPPWPRARGPRKDDGWIARARRFLAALDRSGGDTGHPRLARLDPEVLGAFLLARSSARRRWELEARILAGQGDDEIAGRLGVGEGAVAAYEALC